MDRGVENLIKLGGLSLRDAVQMATTNPARVGKVPGRQQGLARGDRADFVVFHFDSEAHKISVEATYVSGEQVFKRAGY